MSKKVDRAGHWLIKDNPLSVEGVYMYSGKVIDPNGVNGFGLEPDVLYPVYRPKSELAKACASFNGVPFRNEHEMIGDGAGMTPADASVCGGTIFNVRMNPDNDAEMIGDFRINGQEIRNEIEGGKKELSLGYFCKYRRERGEFNGRPYEFVQYDLEGNHVALVKEGRMGSNVRVFDSITFDQLEIPAMKKTKTRDEQKGGVREEIAKMLEGKDEKVLKAVKDAVEGVLNPKDEPPAGDEDEDKTPEEGAEDDPCPHCGTELGLKQKSKDEGEECDKPDGEDEEEQDKPDGKDCGDEEEEEEGEKPAAGDSKAMDMKEVMREIARRDRLADGVAHVIGAFDHSEMTTEEVAVYACDKLELGTDGDCVARIEGYIAGVKKSSVTTTAVDAAEEPSDFEKKYLKQ